MYIPAFYNMKYEEKRKYLLTNYNKARMKGTQKNMDLLTCVFDNGKISIIKCRSQSDCVHEQVAKADCECPLYMY